MSLDVSKVVAVANYINKAKDIANITELRNAITADPESKAEGGPLDDLRKLVQGDNAVLASCFDELQTSSTPAIVVARAELQAANKLPETPPLSSEAEDAAVAAETKRILEADAKAAADAAEAAAKAKADADANNDNGGNKLFSWLKDIPVVGIVIGAVVTLAGIFQAKKHDNFLAGVLAAIGGAAVAGFGVYKYYAPAQPPAENADAQADQTSSPS